jgi:hypothetical protein
MQYCCGLESMAPEHVLPPDFRWGILKKSSCSNREELLWHFSSIFFVDHGVRIRNPNTSLSNCLLSFRGDWELSLNPELSVAHGATTGRYYTLYGIDECIKGIIQ